LKHKGTKAPRELIPVWISPQRRNGTKRNDFPKLTAETPGIRGSTQEYQENSEEGVTIVCFGSSF
jgi:hypothetical protein